jgi:hypothetical protein
MITVYVPRDSAARSVGADEVAAAITHEAARRQLRSYRAPDASCGRTITGKLQENAERVRR